MKLNIFWGELSDNSAIKEALVVGVQGILRELHAASDVQRVRELRAQHFHNLKNMFLLESIHKIFNIILKSEALVLTRAEYFVRHTFPKTYDTRKAEVYALTRAPCISFSRKHIIFWGDLTDVLVTTFITSCCGQCCLFYFFIFFCVWYFDPGKYLCR